MFGVTLFFKIIMHGPKLPTANFCVGTLIFKITLYGTKLNLKSVFNLHKILW